MNSRNNEMEIDLLELFRVWKKKLWLIILVTFLGGTVGFAFSKIALTPMYTSTSMMYAVSKETTLTSLADLQIGSQLTQDYKVIITSRPVLEEVIGDLDLNISYEILKSKISINNPADTRILAITATDPDPQMAKAIVDRTASVSSGYIGDIMEMIPPKIIEEGQVPTQKSSPSNTRNAALGALLGLVLTCGITAMQMILNDTIQTEEDVERYLDLTVLASVPRRMRMERERRLSGNPKRRRPALRPERIRKARSRRADPDGRGEKSNGRYASGIETGKDQ